MEFHEHLKDLRESKGLTQIQAAEAIGIAKNTYIGYEKGNREPRLSELKKLAELFNVNLSELCLEGYNSGLSGWIKMSLEAANELSPKEKGALIRVINGYVKACRIDRLSDVDAWEDRELDNQIELETSIENHFRIKDQKGL